MSLRAPVDARFTDARSRLLGRVAATLADPEPGFPHIGLPDGRWSRSAAGDWTGGFWVGQLWLAARSGDPARFAPAARSWCERLRPRARSATVFRGFLFYYGAVLGSLLFGGDDDRTARQVATEGALGLLDAFQPGAGVFPLGVEAEEASDVGDAETSIDAVGAISGLLAWAAEVTGNPAAREAALRHARWNLRRLVRADGSVCQSATVDPSTGEPRRRYTHKGGGPDSTWARAQSWGLLAATLSARWLPEARAEFLSYGRRIADWWIGAAPADLVAYWDFDVTQAPPTERDTSATAITAAALLKLAALEQDPSRAGRYRDVATRTVEALVARHLDPRGALADACYNPRIGLACRNELIWGDYFLMEALEVLAGTIDPLAI
jgi:unsaturated chondroitin disaccharide hydrolase